MGQLQKAQDLAEQEYIQSQEDIGKYYKDLSETPITEQQDTALNDSVTAAQQQADLNKGLTANEDFNTSRQVQQAKQTQVKKEYSNRLSAELEKKSKKDQLTLSKLNLASEIAKNKYNLAAQRASQAKANWNNASKVLQSLGVMVSAVCPVAGAAIAIGGTAIGAIGAANV